MTDVIVPAPELDMAAAPHLGSRLLESLADGERRLVVDLANVRLIDSAGIGVLLSAARRAQAVGAELVLAHPSEHVRQVFALTGVDRTLTLSA